MAYTIRTEGERKKLIGEFHKLTGSGLSRQKAAKKVGVNLSSLVNWEKKFSNDPETVITVHGRNDEGPTAQSVAETMVAFVGKPGDVVAAIKELKS